MEGVTDAHLPSRPAVVTCPPMPPDSTTLGETLRLRRVDAMQSDAVLVREHPDSAERTVEAQRLIREAMYSRAIGRITDDERDRILDVLSFAIASMQERPADDAPEGQ